MQKLNRIPQLCIDKNRYVIVAANLFYLAISNSAKATAPHKGASSPKSAGIISKSTSGSAVPRAT